MCRLILSVGLVVAMGGCAAAHPPIARPVAAGSACETTVAGISFDVANAPHSTCAILGERTFAIFVTPEHAPPINPSPWYAFRYRADGGAGISVRLEYGEFKHRYRPKLIGQGAPVPQAVKISEDGSEATIELAPGTGIIAAQELFDEMRHEQSLARLAALPNAQRLVLGTSHDGRKIEAVRFGDPDAPGLVVLLGRQHPPEVSGAIAMEAFLDELAARIDAGTPLDGKVQFLAVPLLNPDGVARGHWRANLGGKDLNRDWGEFSQPETKAVKRWLDALPPPVRPVAMVDFHSTGRNLFYVQSEAETDEREEAFLEGWLAYRTEAIAGYAFSVERRNANPGSGTAKNWFHQSYDIPAYTYEVGDETDRQATTTAARLLAQAYLEELANLTAR